MYNTEMTFFPQIISTYQFLYHSKLCCSFPSYFKTHRNGDSESSLINPYIIHLIVLLVIMNSGKLIIFMSMFFGYSRSKQLSFAYSSYYCSINIISPCKASFSQFNLFFCFISKPYSDFPTLLTQNYLIYAS